MKYLLDTDICVYLLTDRFEMLTRRVGECEADSIVLSTVTFAELLMGAAKGKPPPVELLDAFIAEIPLVEFDEAAARAYAGLPFRRARFDRLVGAHALSLGLILITNNEGDFADVPGLKVENWTA